MTLIPFSFWIQNNILVVTNEKERNWDIIFELDGEQCNGRLDKETYRITKRKKLKDIIEEKENKMKLKELIRGSGDYFKLDDIDGKNFIIVEDINAESEIREHAVEVKRDGKTEDATYYDILISVDGEEKDIGLTWTALKQLEEVMPEDIKTWKGATIGYDGTRGSGKKIKYQWEFCGISNIPQKGEQAEITDKKAEEKKVPVPPALTIQPAAPAPATGSPAVPTTENPNAAFLKKLEGLEDFGITDVQLESIAEKHYGTRERAYFALGILRANGSIYNSGQGWRTAK